MVHGGHGRGRKTTADANMRLAHLVVAAGGFEVDLKVGELDNGPGTTRGALGLHGLEAVLARPARAAPKRLPHADPRALGRTALIVGAPNFEVVWAAAAVGQDELTARFVLGGEGALAAASELRRTDEGGALAGLVIAHGLGRHGAVLDIG